METRIVKVNHKEPVRWTELTDEQKVRHNCFAATLIAYCCNSIGEIIPWTQIDQYIPHLYSFVFEEYNTAHQDTKMVFDTLGVSCIRVRRTK